MTKKRITIAMAIVSLAVFFMPGCFKGTTIDLNQDLVITRDVSFSADLIPIFEKSCSISGCHSTGGIAPDLSSGNVYTALTTGNFLDLGNPENSELYGFVSGKISPAMPIGGPDPEIAATILAWIQQGAQNN